MTLAAARPRAQAPLVESRPLRHPDATSAAVMTRRGWWLVVLNFVLPGSAQVLAGNRRLGRFGLGATLAMWTVLILAGATALLSPSVLFAIATGSFVPEFLSWFRPLPLTIVQIALIGYLVLWIVLTIDTLRLVRLVRVGAISRFAMVIVSVGLLVLSGSGAAWAAQAAGTTRDAFAEQIGRAHV